MTQAAQENRIAALDIIRGVAVMGILLMNVIAFAMPDAAYVNPVAQGPASGADLAVWAADFVFIDGKMRGLFSMLFGASMLLVIQRAEDSGRSGGRVHGARMAWLFVFGLAHMILIWWGDILTHYALVGAAAFAFRRAEPYKLVTAAVLLILAQTLLLSGVPSAVEHARVAACIPHPGAQAVSAYREVLSAFGTPPADVIARDSALHRGGYAALVADRWAQAPHLIVTALWSVGLETLGYMLMGMAALRSGMLTGAWPHERYRHWALVAFGVATPCYAVMALIVMARGFDASGVATVSLLASLPLRPVMILGWASAILWLAEPGRPVWRRFGAAGRMAFSNYLGTSLICTTVFYGYGLGLYDRLSRTALLGVVVMIWIAMLAWSLPWLTRFRFGPLEWLWRSLARGRLQPLSLAR